jgi:hypothetical protein
MVWLSALPPLSQCMTRKDCQAYQACRNRAHISMPTLNLVWPDTPNTCARSRQADAPSIELHPSHAQSLNRRLCFRKHDLLLRDRVTKAPLPTRLKLVHHYQSLSSILVSHIYITMISKNGKQSLYLIPTQSSATSVSGSNAPTSPDSVDMSGYLRYLAGLEQKNKERLYKHMSSQPVQRSHPCDATRHAINSA